MCVANRSELTADALRQQLRQQLTDSEIAEIERAAWEQVLKELRYDEVGKPGFQGGLADHHSSN